MDPLKFISQASATAGDIGNIGNTIGNWVDLIGGQQRREKLFQEQLSQQNRMDRQTAGINFAYGEQSANNAFQRQMQLYERQFADNHPEAQRARLEAAGFNPALMYGQMGTTGGANATSAPQGQTGGARGSEAPNPMEVMQVRLQQRMMEAQIRLLNAQANEANTNADFKGGAETQHTLAMTDLIGEEIQSKQVERAGQKLLNEINEIKKNVAEATEHYQIQQIKEDFHYTIQRTNSLLLTIDEQKEDLDIKRRTKENVIRKVGAELSNIYADTKLKQSHTDLSNTNIESIKNNLIFVWVKLLMDAAVEVRGQGRGTLFGLFNNIVTAIFDSDTMDGERLINIFQQFKDKVEDGEGMNKDTPWDKIANWFTDQMSIVQK